MDGSARAVGVARAATFARAVAFARPVTFAVLGLALLLMTGCQRVGLPTPASPGLPPPSTDRRLPQAPAESAPDGLEPERQGDPGSSATDAPSRAGRSLDTLPRDVRALWVVRTALVHPDSARAAVRRAHAAGFNTLLVQVRGRGDAFYSSRWEPRAELLLPTPSDYDPLATVLEESELLGMAVHVWVNAQVVASAVRPPGDPRHLVNQRPDWVAVPRPLGRELFAVDPREGRYLRAIVDWTRENQGSVEGLFANPAHPEAAAHLRRVVGDLVERYPVDGVHLDYLRYPSPEFDYSRASLKSFRVWVRDRLGSGASAAEVRWPSDPFAYVQAFPELWNRFREERINETALALASEVRRLRPGVLVSAAVFPDPADARRARYQDWAGWVGEGIVDVVVPMAYTADDGVFEAQIETAREIVDRRRVWAGIGVYRNSFDGSVRKSMLAQGLGVAGTAVFSYDWAVSPAGWSAAGGPFLTRYGAAVWGLRGGDQGAAR